MSTYSESLWSNDSFGIKNRVYLNLKLSTFVNSTTFGNEATQISLPKWLPLLPKSCQWCNLALYTIAPISNELPWNMSNMSNANFINLTVKTACNCINLHEHKGIFSSPIWVCIRQDWTLTVFMVIIYHHDRAIYCWEKPFIVIMESFPVLMGQFTFTMDCESGHQKNKLITSQWIPKNMAFWECTIIWIHRTLYKQKSRHLLSFFVNHLVLIDLIEIILSLLKNEE